MEKADDTMVTAGVASLAAVIVILVGVVSLVAWQYRTNRALNKRLIQMQQEGTDEEKEAMNANSNNSQGGGGGNSGDMVKSVT